MFSRPFCFTVEKDRCTRVQELLEAIDFSRNSMHAEPVVRTWLAGIEIEGWKPLLGARLRGRTATQHSKEGSEKVLGRVLQKKGSQKGSQKWACYAYYSLKKRF